MTDSEPEDDVEGPLGDLAATADRRMRRTGDDARGTDEGPDTGSDEDALLEAAFEEVSVEHVDPEEVWADLVGDDPVAIPELDFEADEAAGAPDSGVRVIPSSTCHRCRFFAEPPTFGCTHEGTEIRELVEAGRYEVVDCPMVLDFDADDPDDP